VHNLNKRCVMWTRVCDMDKMRSVGKGCMAWKKEVHNLDKRCVWTRVCSMDEVRRINKDKGVFKGKDD
jgi:hypothetical protein